MPPSLLSSSFFFIFHLSDFIQHFHAPSPGQTYFRVVIAKGKDEGNLRGQRCIRFFPFILLTGATCSNEEEARKERERERAAFNILLL